MTKLKKKLRKIFSGYLTMKYSVTGVLKIGLINKLLLTKVTKGHKAFPKMKNAVYN